MVMISVGTDTDYCNPDLAERPRSGVIFCRSFCFVIGIYDSKGLTVEVFPCVLVESCAN